jgi:hypothetical protein
LDQVSDARDLSAHIYKMAFRGEHDRPMRWVGLVFTLMGCIPEVGSVIKSMSKVAIKGAAEFASRISEIVKMFAKWIPFPDRDVGRIATWIGSNWSRWAEFVTQKWTAVLMRSEELVREVAKFSTTAAEWLREKVGLLREMTATHLEPAIQQGRKLLDDVMAKVAPKTEGHQAFKLHMNRSGASQKSLPDTSASDSRELSLRSPATAGQASAKLTKEGGELSPTSRVQSPARIEATRPRIRKTRETTTYEGAPAASIEGEVGPTVKRKGLERKVFPSPRPEGYEAAHLWGAGLGDESAVGIMLAPKSVNQSLQKMLDNQIRRLRDALARVGGKVDVVNSVEGHLETSIPAALREFKFAKDIQCVISVKPHEGAKMLTAARIRFSIPAPPHGRNAAVLPVVEFVDEEMLSLFEGTKALSRK